MARATASAAAMARSVINEDICHWWIARRLPGRYSHAVDFVSNRPIPARLVAPLRAVLRDDASDWPDDLHADEVAALVAHGVAPLVYARTNAPALRADAIRAAALEPVRAADLTVILDALAARGVEALILKGGALAYQVYDAPELRPRRCTGFGRLNLTRGESKM